MSNKKKSKRNQVPKMRLVDKQEKILQPVKDTEIYKQGMEVVESYENFVNGNKFLTFTNKLIDGCRLILSYILFIFVLLVISAITARVSVAFIELSMSSISFLSETFVMMFSTSFVTAVMTSLIFKGNIYKKCYTIISKIFPYVKDSRKDEK